MDEDPKDVENNMDDMMEWYFRTPLRRALSVLLAPVWVPLLLVVAFIVAVGGTLLWCPTVKIISWVLYGDHYVLGHLWWVWGDDHEIEVHKRRTNTARARLGIPRKF